MIRRDDNERVRSLGGKVERRLYGIVEGECLADRIFIVASGRCLIDPATLDHQEEAVRVGVEEGDRLRGHLGEARLP